MSAWKTKTMLALIWMGVMTLMGASGNSKGWLDWIMLSAQVGLLGGLAVALRHYYKQIKINAVREYRFNLMWAHYVKEHQLDNGDVDDRQL